MLEKKKILIVDDDGFLLDMYALKFNQNNFEVHTASSGQVALEKLRSALVPDIVLLDIVMPEMDGFELLENMNKENLAPETARIILTNKSEPADIERGKGMGIDGYIIKANSTPAEVIVQVGEILSKRDRVRS
jgi:CheY-like chemotaxis protein